MHNSKSVQENRTHNIFWDFGMQTDHLTSPGRPDLLIVIKKQKQKQKKPQRTCRIVDFAVPTDHRPKLKESEKRNNNLELARELKKKQLLHMKLRVISVVIGALGTVTKGLVKGQDELKIRGRVETFQITALLRSVRILRRVLET